ncbi:hypothetical protein AGMMS50268_24910 [Spirochaetia bacterium]|nr:hypothetical protein AGMMS50268_24910 [Spirochaetia bacterium]
MRRALIVLIAILFAGCVTAPVTPPPDHLGAEYRVIQENLTQKQTDLAITGTVIEQESKGIVQDIADLQTSLTSVTPENWDAEKLNLTAQVLNLQGRAIAQQERAEMLNMQLAAERETNTLLNRKFNEYDFAHNQVLSDRETEITRLKVENKSVKGQRNTLLAIVIGIAVIVIAAVAVKVMRVMRVIPF